MNMTQIEDLLAARKGSCVSCPFNDGLTFAASEAQNYGCLPTAGEIVAMKRETGQNWACHDDESRVCSGLCHVAKDESLDLAQGGLIKYSTWYHQGQEASVKEAQTGMLFHRWTGPEFDRALYGDRADGPATLHQPRLKYYEPRSAVLSRHEDTRVFFAVCTPPSSCKERGHTLRTVVALMELETSPYDAQELWLKYISVHPLHQRQGYGRWLVKQAIQEVRKTRQKLSVSYATDESKEKGFQSLLVSMLTDSGAIWSQSSY